MEKSNYEIQIFDHKKSLYVYKKRLTLREAIRLFWSGEIKISKDELFNI